MVHYCLFDGIKTAETLVSVPQRTPVGLKIKIYIKCMLQNYLWFVFQAQSMIVLTYSLLFLYDVFSKSPPPGKGAA